MAKQSNALGNPMTVRQETRAADQLGEQLTDSLPSPMARYTYSVDFQLVSLKNSTEKTLNGAI
jgi:hypothetical protein